MRRFAQSAHGPVARLHARRAQRDRGLILDERFQACQRVIPLFRDALEGANRLVERVGLELEETLASFAHPAHEARPFEHAQMLGNGLTRQG